MHFILPLLSAATLLAAAPAAASGLPVDGGPSRAPDALHQEKLCLRAPSSPLCTVPMGRPPQIDELRTVAHDLHHGAHGLTAASAPDVRRDWLAPADTARIGAGDCEDWAVMAAEMLTGRGVGPGYLYFVMLQRPGQHTWHMILTANLGEQLYVVGDTLHDQVAPLAELYPRSRLQLFMRLDRPRQWRAWYTKPLAAAMRGRPETTRVLGQTAHSAALTMRARAAESLNADPLATPVPQTGGTCPVTGLQSARMFHPRITSRLVTAKAEDEGTAAAPVAPETRIPRPKPQPAVHVAAAPLPGQAGGSNSLP